MAYDIISMKSIIEAVSVFLRVITEISRNILKLEASDSPVTAKD